MAVGKITAYKAVKLLKAEGLSITEKTLSVWKSQERVKVYDNGLVDFEEVRSYLIESKKEDKAPPEKKSGKKTDGKVIKQSPKKKSTPRVEEKEVIKKNPGRKPDDKELEDVKALHIKKLFGDAWKSFYASQKAEIELQVARGELVDRSVIDDYINATFSAHNKRLINSPEKLADICIAIVRSKEDDNDARVMLIRKWKSEISGILDSEKKEVKRYLRRKSK